MPRYGRYCEIAVKSLQIASEPHVNHLQTQYSPNQMAYGGHGSSQIIQSCDPLPRDVSKSAIANNFGEDFEHGATNEQGFVTDCMDSNPAASRTCTPPPALSRLRTVWSNGNPRRRSTSFPQPRASMFLSEFETDSTLQESPTTGSGPRLGKLVGIGAVLV
jgi:hypothetical protein